MNFESKYTRVEYERRFLVSPFSDWMNHVEGYTKSIEDKYLHSTKMRVRSLIDSDTGRRLLKLTKKPESESPYCRTISRILLSPVEYELLSSLAGDQIKKVRYYHKYLDRVYSIDVFVGQLDGLILCETEAEGLEDLLAAEPPRYAKYEVTDDPFFSGGNLCQTDRRELLQKLMAFN